MSKSPDTSNRAFAKSSAAHDRTPLPHPLLLGNRDSEIGRSVSFVPEHSRRSQHRPGRYPRPLFPPAAGQRIGESARHVGLWSRNQKKSSSVRDRANHLTYSATPKSRRVQKSAPEPSPATRRSSKTQHPSSKTESLLVATARWSRPSA